MNEFTTTELRTIFTALNGANMEAVRGGFAYRRQAMHSTNNYHCVHREGFREMIFCGCSKQVRGLTFANQGLFRLKRKGRKDERWAADFRYKVRRSSTTTRKP